MVPHCLPTGGSLTLGTLSLGWSRAWGGLGQGRGKWSHGEGEGGGDLDSASSGAELVWEHLRAHLEKQQRFKCPSLAFRRWGEMKALCPSVSCLHRPEGPPWGAVPPPWPPVHADTPHRGDSPGATQGNTNKLLSALSPPWRHWSWPCREAEPHQAPAPGPGTTPLRERPPPKMVATSPCPAPQSQGQVALGQALAARMSQQRHFFPLMSGFFEPLAPFWTLGWAQVPHAHSHGRTGALLGSAGSHLPTDGTAGPRGAICLPCPPPSPWHPMAATLRRQPAWCHGGPGGHWAGPRQPQGWGFAPLTSPSGSS